MNSHVTRAFDAAHGYDAHARVQRHAAEALADRILALPLPPAPRILEIGCGTGFLARALIDRLPGAEWLLTDIAPAMIDRCTANIGPRPNVTYRVMDGEHPELPPAGFDLVCSSFTFQWFADLPAAVARLRALLRHGGTLAFATMANGSLAEWQAAHQTATGVAAAMPDYPTLEMLRSMNTRVEAEYRVEQHEDARAFLTALRAIGAHRPIAPRPPLGIAMLRRAMAAFEAQGAAITYHIAYGVIAA